MDTVLHTTAIYVLLLLLLALFGKRSLSSVTVFDFIVLILIAEAAGQVLLGEESVTTAVLAVITLLTLSWLLDILAFRSERANTLLNDTPTVIVDDGRLLEDRARDFHLDTDDILRQARSAQGLERMDQVKYAILERDGQISIIPR